VEINVIDAIMGAGKSTFIIDQLKADTTNTRYLVIVPTLDEIKRMRLALPNFNFKEPGNKTPGDKEDDKKRHGTKFYDLGFLIRDREQIISTHALFYRMDRATYAAIAAAGYTLIIDEVLTTVDLYKGLVGRDRDIMFAQDMVSINKETWRLEWNEQKWGDYNEGRFSDIRKLCDTGSLVASRGEVLLWEFPAEFIRCFRNVWLCTYLFDASPFSAYLKAEGFKFQRWTIEDRRLVSWEEAPGEAAIKARIRELVTVYRGTANDIGKEDGLRQIHPFSKGWYDRQNSDTLKSIKASTSNFFRNVAKVRSNRLGWSTFKKTYQNLLKGPGYGRNSDREGDSYGFIPWNCRATNDYMKVTAGAYLVNVYYHPVVKGYFVDLGVNVSDDLFALSTLVQWCWRSCIRNHQPGSRPSMWCNFRV
jgi:hypothetical protein